MTGAVIRLALVALLVVGCSRGVPAASTSTIVSAAQPGPVELDAGGYWVAWDSGGCAPFRLIIAPTDGRPPITDVAQRPTGLIQLDIPKGLMAVSHVECPNAVVTFTPT